MDMSYERGYETNYLSRSNYVMDFYFLVVNKYISIFNDGGIKPRIKLHSLRMAILTL